MDSLFRQRFGVEKLSLIVDITADNGQEQHFKLDSKNIDLIQRLRFTLPVKEITISASGFGFVGVWIREVYIESEQQITPKPTPFQLTTEFSPMPWFNEVMAKSCVTYTPSPADKLLAKDSFNRTIIVEVQLPSGMRLNLRQIGFFLSQVPEAMYFTYHERANKINFFFTVPSTSFGKQICFKWGLERLSFVQLWKPVQIRAYDYLQRDTELVRLVSIDFKPNPVGYKFVEAVKKNSPTIEQLRKMHEEQQQRM